MVGADQFGHSSNSDRIESDSEPLLPQRCTWCFTLKGVAITTITCVVTVAILIFVLDFTVLELNRVKRNYYEEKAEMFQDGGVIDVEPTFSNYFHLKIIDLHDVQTDVSQLLKFMTGGYQMEVIRLRNMKLTGKLPKVASGNTHGLPHLREFLFELNQPIGPEEDFQIDPCDECVIRGGFNSSIESIRQLRCLGPLLFNINTKRESAFTLEYSMWQMNITITVYGRTLFRILTTPGDIREMTTMINDCDSIFGNGGILMFRHPTKVAISGCTNLNVSTLNYMLRVQRLTHLTLDTVTLVGLAPTQRLSEVFKNAPMLTELVIKGSPFKKPVNSTPELLNVNDYKRQIAITDLPGSLRTLVLSDVVLVNTISSQKLTLDSLKLNNVLFQDVNTLESFPNVIDVKKLAFRQLTVGPTIGDVLKNSAFWVPFMNKLMEQTREIWFENPFYYPLYSRGVDAETARQLSFSLVSWRQWLRKKGIDGSILMNHDPALILAKSEEGIWDVESRSDGSGGSNANAATWFHYLRIGKFVREDLWNVVEW